MNLLKRLDKLESCDKPDVPHRRVVVWYINLETEAEALQRERVEPNEDVAIIEMEMVESKT